MSLIRHLKQHKVSAFNNHKDWLHNWNQISTDLVLFISTSSRNTCNLKNFLPVGMVELLDQPATIGKSNLNVSDGLGGVEGH